MNSLLAPESPVRPLATVSIEELEPAPIGLSPVHVRLVCSNTFGAKPGNGNKAKRRLIAMRAAKSGFALLEAIHEEINGLVPASSFGFRF